ncbi:hypothetical protein, partial [uncultured Parabacteroides sp.]|uniref:hypothetical protein n=1 Tax=uncultured Parabacteroides sp. TaxID=512312 RepID=UPI0028045E16
EHVICNLGVVGSNPTRGSQKEEVYLSKLPLFFIIIIAYSCKRINFADINFKTAIYDGRK